MAAGDVGLIEESRRGALAPVQHRGRWIASGLLLQVIGVAAPTIYLAAKAKKENVGGSITLSTVRLAWHDALHNHAGLALLIAGAVLFAVGATLLARPFANSLPLLLVAVPVAALAGLMVLGAGVLVIVLIIGIASIFDGDIPSWGSDTYSDGRKRKRRLQGGDS